MRFYVIGSYACSHLSFPRESLGNLTLQGQDSENLRFCVIGSYACSHLNFPRESLENLTLQGHDSEKLVHGSMLSD